MYEELDNTTFVPLDCVYPEYLGKYEINKLGQVKNKVTGNLISSNSLNSGGYPFIKLSGKSGEKAVYKLYMVHVLLARTFIPNPNGYTSVDHIDNNRENYSLSNLRWASISQQNKNKTNTRHTHTVYITTDLNGNEIGVIQHKDLDKKEQRKVSMAAFRKKPYKGLYWKLVNPEVENYIKLHGQPKDSDWRDCLRFPKELECNINGLFRWKKSKRIVLGSIIGGYYNIAIHSKQFKAHRLIYETFSGQLLTSDIDVGHKDTNRLNNEFSNLEACTRKENMNNPLTKAKFAKSINQYSLEGDYIKTFSSLKEASDEIGASVDNYKHNRLNIVEGYIWCKPGDKIQIDDIKSRMIYKYDKNWNLIKIYTFISKAALDSSYSRGSIDKSIKSGKICPDGFYYTKGPKEK